MSAEALASLIRRVRVETGQLALAAQGDDALRLRAMEIDLLAEAVNRRLGYFSDDPQSFPLVSERFHP